MGYHDHQWGSINFHKMFLLVLPFLFLYGIIIADFVSNLKLFLYTIDLVFEENMEYQFSRTALTFGKENMNKLAQSRVIVFGIGGVGSFVVEALPARFVNTSFR